MKKTQKTKLLILIAVAVVILAAYLIYSRPMSLPQMYPMLTLDQCTEIHGYFRIEEQPEQTRFTVSASDEAFQDLCDTFYGRRYRRSLRSIFARGARYHRVEPGDFQWEVYFHFEDVELPDGSFGSGAMLHIQNWYGELDLYFDGERVSLHTDDEEAWCKEVLNLIR